MNTKTAPVQKSPEEIALEALRDSLAKLSAEAFVAGAEIYTHGYKLKNVIAINSVNAIIVQATGNVQGIRSSLKDGLLPVPA